MIIVVDRGRLWCSAGVRLAKCWSGAGMVSRLDCRGLIEHMFAWSCVRWGLAYRHRGQLPAGSRSMLRRQEFLVGRRALGAPPGFPQLRVRAGEQLDRVTSGVLEVDPRPPCSVLISPARRICGRPSARCRQHIAADTPDRTDPRRPGMRSAASEFPPAARRTAAARHRRVEHWVNTP
jgi:hypothetical protein